MVAVLATVLALASAIGLEACGGASPSAQTLLSDTFQSHKPIESGQIDLALKLAASGYAPLAQPVALQLSGPFQSLGAKRLPRFALQVSLALGGQPLKAGAVSTGSRLFVELGGSPFEAPAATVSAVQKSFAQATSSASAGKGSGTFASLGLNPSSWLEHPVDKGTVQIAGEQTTHIEAGLNVTRFLTDTDRLSGVGNSTGLSGAAPGLALLAPSEIPALSRSVKSARVDVYTGRDDHLLRRLSVSATVATDAKDRAALQGLRSASLSLQLGFTDVNKPQRIVAPSNPQPLSDLQGYLQQLGILGSGSTASSG